ncbi:sigma factor [Nonomuraea guangzhouensis]|uniref:Sigma factor n=1 Tax=Nonomuraea guangzhouensis TaxID=1291555 RepID=A0ABW4GEM2_9ACTN
MTGVETHRHVRDDDHPGVHRAFAALGPLLHTAYLLTRDWALAEDLVQTALLKAWVAWVALRGPALGARCQLQLPGHGQARSRRQGDHPHEGLYRQDHRVRTPPGRAYPRRLPLR